MTPGYRSTEFWAFVVYAAVVVLSGLAFITIDNETMATFAGVASAYILGRSYVKGKQS